MISNPEVRALIAQRAENRKAIESLVRDNHALTEAITRLLTGEAEAIVAARLEHMLAKGREAA